MRRALPLLVLALAACLPARGQETAPAEETPPEARRAASWQLCRVEISTLFNSPRGSRVVGRDTALLFQGEDFDFTRELALDAGDKQALLRLRARLRASVSLERGAIYRVTTETTLASAVGFLADVGREHVRDGELVFDEDPSPRFFETYASPDLAGRLVLAVTSRPADPEKDLGGAADEDSMRQFRVEALLQEEEGRRIIQQAVLQAMPGQPAALAFGSFGAQAKLPEDPSKRLGASVRVVDLGQLPDSGYGSGRTMVATERPHLTGYVDEQTVQLDDRFLDEHVVFVDDTDDPKHVTVLQKSPKMSNAKKRKLRALEQANAARRLALERAMTLPEGEAVPEGFEKEELVVEIRPLHASRFHVQAEIVVRGRVKLPGEAELTAVDASFVERLAIGEPFDVGLGGLVRGSDPASDYVVRITPLM